MFFYYYKSVEFMNGLWYDTVYRVDPELWFRRLHVSSQEGH